MRTQLRDLPSRLQLHRILPVLSIAVAVGAVAAAVANLPLAIQDWWILVAFAAVIAVGEVNRIVLPGGRETAPMSLAAGYALAMTWEVGETHRVEFTAGVVVAVTTVGMLAGAVPALLRRSPVRADDLAARFLSVAVVALLFRHLGVWNGEPLLTLQDDWLNDRWMTAVSMVLVSAIALLVQAFCVAM